MIEFDYNETQYRLTRAETTGEWMLFENTGDRRSWHLANVFDKGIYDEDIKDRALVALKGIL